MTTATTRTLAVTINAPFTAVVTDLSDPLTHPQWGTEFFYGPAKPAAEPGVVDANVPMMGGPVRMRISAVPEHGVIDLFLAPAGAPFGEPLPIRVVPNGDGADVLFTLARAAGMPEPAWDQAVSSMGRELDQLKARLESAVQS